MVLESKIDSHKTTSKELCINPILYFECIKFQTIDIIINTYYCQIKNKESIKFRNIYFILLLLHYYKCIMQILFKY